MQRTFSTKNKITLHTKKENINILCHMLCAYIPKAMTACRTI